MSHRVTVQTEIKDKALAIAALKAANITFREQGDTLRLMSGSFENAVINLKTGAIEGDTDWKHTQEKLGILRQHYSEAKYRVEAQSQGISIMERSVDREGSVRLRCRMG